ncbi:uncharacterized protein O3C94_000207 [Discoglossus pictus]
MAPADNRDTRARMRCMLSAIIATVTSLLFIASFVLVIIGYLNPFGSVGLGILGGGAVLFFSTILLLCVGFVWLNRKYPEEPEVTVKLFEPPSDEMSLLKPTSNPAPLHETRSVARLKDLPMDKAPHTGNLQGISSTATQKKVVFGRSRGNDYSDVLKSGQALEPRQVVKGPSTCVSTELTKIPTETLYKQDASSGQNICTPLYSGGKTNVGGSNQYQDEWNQIKKTRRQSADVLLTVGDLSHNEKSVHDIFQQQKAAEKPHVKDVNTQYYAKQRKSDPLLLLKNLPTAQTPRATIGSCASMDQNLHNKKELHGVPVTGFNDNGFKSNLLPSKTEIPHQHHKVPLQMGRLIVAQQSASNIHQKRKPEGQSTEYHNEQYNKAAHTQGGQIQTNEENKQTFHEIPFKAMHSSSDHFQSESKQRINAITLQPRAPSNQNEHTGVCHSTQVHITDASTRDFRVNKRYAWAMDRTEY